MKRYGRSGTVIIEFAAVVFILVALATGIADAGLAFRIKHVLRIASREGARVASVTPGLDPATPTAVLDVVDGILEEANLDASPGISVTAPNGLETGRPVTVTVTYNYNPLFPGIGLAGGLELQSSTTMRYEVLASS